MARPDLRGCGTMRNPPRVRCARHRNGIPVGTEINDQEVNQLVRLWNELGLRPDLRAARVAIGRILTTKAEDL